MSDSNCINPVDFNTASAAWTDAVARENDLLYYFQNSVVPPQLPPPPPPLPVNKLQYVTFPVTDMISLVSTVGVRYIRAQFILLAPVNGKPRFTVALYALDSLKCRISAYFAGAAGAMIPAEPASSDNGAVPFDLVQHWILAWQAPLEVRSDMFDTNYGPLQGYIFDLKDFIEPLFPPMDPTSTYELRVYLGLHSYQITSGSDTIPDDTVGLILSVQKQGSTRLPLSFNRKKSLLVPGNSGQSDDDADGYYDLSHPNPPGMATTY